MRLGAAALLLLGVFSWSSGRVEASGTTAPSTESGSSDWKTVSAGDSHTCGIRTTGRLYCWGNDDFGQVGDGGANIDRSIPVEVAGGATDWTAVDAGDFHTCARRATGRLYCWGGDAAGQLGTGAGSGDQTTPVEVSGGATNWTAVSAGPNHTCARRATGRLYCWGVDAAGQLGNGLPNLDRPAPVPVAGGVTNWTAVSAGRYHTCARRATGQLYCWGFDGEGQLGNGGPNAGRSSPGLVAGGATNWTAVTAGHRHTCARRATGRLYCWGWDVNGELGNGPAGTQPVPFLVAGGATDWTSVTATNTHTCGRRSTGHLWCWGLDQFGQLGNGAPNVNQPAPVAVSGGATDWVSVTAGGTHTCARITTGRLFCWGQDGRDQLGDGGAEVDSAEPVEVDA